MRFEFEFEFEFEFLFEHALDSGFRFAFEFVLQFEFTRALGMEGIQFWSPRGSVLVSERRV